MQNENFNRAFVQLKIFMDNKKNKKNKKKSKKNIFN